jgi:hypothetical protein
MFAKLSALLFIALSSALAVFVVGRSRKLAAFDARAIALCVMFALLAATYIYWKSRPA